LALALDALPLAVGEAGVPGVKWRTVGNPEGRVIVPGKPSTVGRVTTVGIVIAVGSVEGQVRSSRFVTDEEG